MKNPPKVFLGWCKPTVASSVQVAGEVTRGPRVYEASWMRYQILWNDVWRQLTAMKWTFRQRLWWTFLQLACQLQSKCNNRAVQSAFLIRHTCEVEDYLCKRGVLTSTRVQLHNICMIIARSGRCRLPVLSENNNALPCTFVNELKRRRNDAARQEEHKRWLFGEKSVVCHVSWPQHDKNSLNSSLESFTHSTPPPYVFFLVKQDTQGSSCWCRRHLTMKTTQVSFCFIFTRTV